MKKLVLSLCALAVAAHAQQLVSATPVPFVGTSTTVTLTVATPPPPGNYLYFAFLPDGSSAPAAGLAPAGCVVQIWYFGGVNYTAAALSPAAGGNWYENTGAITSLDSGYTNAPSNPIGHANCTVYGWPGGSSQQLQADGTLQITLRMDFNFNTFSGVKTLWFGWRNCCDSSAGPVWVGPLSPGGVISKWYIGNPGTSISGGTPSEIPSTQDDYAPTVSFQKTGTYNLAVGRQATLSSTPQTWGYNSAEDAVDGSGYGYWTGDWHNSISHSNLDQNGWWQVDLGASATVSSISVWGRTASNQDRLADYWMFVSDSPFLAGDTPATLASRPGTWSNHQLNNIPNPVVSMPVNASGRYVRLQLSGANYVQVAEVQVFGTSPLNDYFAVGEGYSIQLTGAPNSQVVRTRTLNGNSAGTFYYLLGSDGTLLINGSMQNSDVGVWADTWSSSGYTMPIIKYAVGPASPSLAKLSFTNTTRGGSSSYSVGDAYHFDIYAPPNAVLQRQSLVSSPSTGNQFVPGWQVTVYADSTGHWSYDDVIYSPEVGLWNTSWTANGIPIGAPFYYVIQ